MIKLLKEVFKKEDLLQESYDNSIEMLKMEKEMFVAAHESLRKSDSGEMSIDIYALDKKINEHQRDIRRKVLAHMIASASKDIVFGLIQVSIVIDIERIGDYVKNMVDLANSHPKRLTAGDLEEKLQNLGKKIPKRLETLIKAFEDSDVDAARSLMSKHRSITKRCEELLTSLISENHPELTTGDAVAVALYVRYLKRISSHITNIASGIVNPFDRIGFTE